MAVLTAGNQAVLETQLAAQNVPGEIAPAVLAAIAAAGWTIEAGQAGGAASATTSLPGTIYSVSGMPGVHVRAVAIGAGKALLWLEFTPIAGGSVQRSGVVLGDVPTGS